MAPTSSSRNPTSWDEYDGRASPSGSLTSSLLGQEQALVDDEEGTVSHSVNQGRDRRRSSVTNRLAAVADFGGVNSFRSFARSWQRAAAFTEVIPSRPSFVYASDALPAEHPSQHHAPLNPPDHQESVAIQYGRSLVDARSPTTGLLRQQMEGAVSSPPGPHTSNSGIPEQGNTSFHPARRLSGRDDFRVRESKALDAEMGAAGPLLAGGDSAAASTSSRSSIFAIPPHLATPIIGSYGSYRSTYGTMGHGSLRARTSSGQLSNRYSLGGEEGEDPAHGEDNAILVKEIKQGNKVVLTVEGQSTLYQSIFNSINAIIGVGLLSLPLAFRLSGWVFGLVILTLTAAVTSHTSNLLARCMRFDPSLITYSDLAYVSFGTKARIVVSALFTLELLAACVALIILFANSLQLLVGDIKGLGNEGWKVVCAVLILALNSVPLKWLSYTSVIGILSTFCIVVIVMSDGLIKQESPGSLWQPATTYFFPENWLSLPLAYGLLASPWGAHSVFPSIYRDMRHPHKWGTAVKVTFSFSYILDTLLACVGILMFGPAVHDAITSDILEATGYPRALTITMSIFIAIIPLTKIPLNVRPIITTADVLFGVHHSPQHYEAEGSGEPSRKTVFLHNLCRVAIRVFVVTVLLLISILFPSFDTVCAFLGAVLCTLISIVLPISFYLKLFWKDVQRAEKIVLGIVLVTFSCLGLVGTIWTFLPKKLVGA